MSELPPATLEGWYVLHQIFSVDWASLRQREAAARDALTGGATRLMERLASAPGGGWSAAYRLAGGGADVMLVHFRDSLEALADADEAFLTSTTREVQPIRGVDGKALPAAPGPLTREASKALAAVVASDADP